MRTSLRQAFFSVLAGIALGLAVTIAAFTLAGCGTVVPETVTSSEASFDGAEQNSGIIGLAPGGYYVTAHFHDRYDALARVWGKRFTPEANADLDITLRTVTQSEGPDVSPTVREFFFIDREHMVKFIEMNAWHKAGRTPQ